MSDFYIDIFSGGQDLLDVDVTVNALSGIQNSTIFTFTESGSELSQVTHRIYLFDNETSSIGVANPTYQWKLTGVRTAYIYLYSSTLNKVFSKEIEFSISQPDGFFADYLAGCEIACAMTKEVTDYNGPLITLLRENDYRTRDFYPNEFGVLDIDEITAWSAETPDNITLYPLDEGENKELGWSMNAYLTTGYTGNLFRLRRGDGVEEDFSPATFSAITDFISGYTLDEITIPVLYNQGSLGSVGDMIQTTVSQQPTLLITGGTYYLNTNYTGTTTRYLNISTQNTVNLAFNNNANMNVFFNMISLPQPSAVPICFAINGPNRYFNHSNAGLVGFGMHVAGNVQSHTGSYDLNSGSYSHSYMARMDAPVGEPRYVMYGTNFDDTIPVLNSFVTTYRPTGNIITPTTSWLIGYTTNGNGFKGLISDAIVTSEKYDLNKYYKIKKYVGDRVGANTYRGDNLLVHTWYNQKDDGVTKGHFFFKQIGQMPKFIVSSPLHNNMPVIYSELTLSGPRYWPGVRTDNYNGNIYPGQYTYVTTSKQVSGSMMFNSITAQNSYSYDTFIRNANAALISSSIGYVGSNKIIRFQVDIPGASGNQRTTSLGTTEVISTNTISSGTAGSTRNMLFNWTPNNSNSTYGYMNSLFSFNGYVPSGDTWTTMYNVLKTKYGTDD